MGFVTFKNPSMKNKWHIEKGVKCYAVLAIIISKESDELCEYLKYSSFLL